MLIKIKTTLYNINRWYDNIDDTYRFLLFMLLVVICYIPSVILISVGIKSDLTVALPTLLLIPFGIIRWLWLTKRLRIVNK